MPEKLTFKKAERRKSWLKLALTGPSGSGKTFSALLIASGIGKRIALIDTENESASLYAGMEGIPPFDKVNIASPYTIEKYVEAIRTAWELKYDVLIIDSISHAWAGEGGLLEQKEDLDARGTAGDRKNKNQYANWASITKQHEKFKAWLLKAEMHLICTMRSKQDYVLAGDGKIQKVGMAPIQREGMEYEMTTVFDLAMNHSALASKDRTSIFDKKIFVPDAGTGKLFMDWLSGAGGDLVAKSVKDPLSRPAAEDPLAEDRKALFAVGAANGYNDAGIKALCQEMFPGVQSRRDLKKGQIQMLIQWIRAQPLKKPAPPAETEMPPMQREDDPPLDPSMVDFMAKEAQSQGETQASV